MSLEKVLAVAESQLGKTEYPKGSNLTPYGQAYGLNGYPWCVMFLWWCFREAKENMAFFGGAQTASCGQLLRWYKGMGLTVPVEEIRTGDIVILNFSGTQDTEHCGLVTRVMGAGRFRTIEGNTTPGEEGSQDYGGSVAQKTRFAANVVGVCRPVYTPDKPLDYAGHWAEEAINYAKAQGLMVGYPDGNFHPDEPCTRAQVAEILWRMGAKSK